MFGRFLDAIARWSRGYFVPVPVGRAEWVVIRILFALAMLDTFLDYRPYTYSGQPAPNGIAHVFSLTFLNQPWMGHLFLGIAAIACVIYATGYLLGPSLLVLTVLSTLARTYFNSQGYIHHGYQIVTLTMLGQLLVVGWLAVYPLFKKGKPFPFPAGLNRASYLLYYSQGVVVGTYVIAGLKKLINTWGMWPYRSQYIPIEMIKSNRQQFYKDLDPALLGNDSLAVWLADHPLVSIAIFGGGFVLEVAAILALRNRAWAFWIGILLIALHRGIAWLMGLDFKYNEVMCLIFLVNVPFWVLWVGTRFTERTRTPLTAST